MEYLVWAWYVWNHMQTRMIIHEHLLSARKRAWNGRKEFKKSSFKAGRAPTFGPHLCEGEQSIKMNTKVFRADSWCYEEHLD